jgi:hypothetical protein
MMRKLGNQWFELEGEADTRKTSWLDAAISDDFCRGILVGFCVVAGAMILIMAVLRLVD